MRIIYRLLTLLLTPLALLWLSRRPAATGQRGRWRERLGWIPPGRPGRIWIHAASVGELNAAQGLIRALLARGESILLSTMTQTGAVRCGELFAGQVDHHYLPLDNRPAVRAWIKRARPRIGLIMETEIWPELLACCHQRNIPTVLVNARISQGAERLYRRWPGLIRTALAQLSLVVAQTRSDAERLVGLGLPAERVCIAGNLKFDLTLPSDLQTQAERLRQRWGARPVWVAGSTRPGEEAILIEAHRHLRQSLSNALLVLAPRHPQRAESVARQAQAAGLSCCGHDEAPLATTAIVLIDRLGVLLPAYAAGDAAFVGGSLVALGGHNLIEPAALGKPVMAGPHLDQQAEAAGILGESGALAVVTDASALTATLKDWLADPQTRHDLGAAAQVAVRSGSGSLKATLAALAPWLARAEISAAAD